MNLGRLVRSRGAFSAALAHWTRAWTLAKDDQTPFGRAVADDAMGERLRFAAELGSVPLLEPLLAEAGARVFRGKAVERVTRARGGSSSRKCATRRGRR